MALQQNTTVSTSYDQDTKTHESVLGLVKQLYALMAISESAIHDICAIDLTKNTLIKGIEADVIFTKSASGTAQKSIKHPGIKALSRSICAGITYDSDNKSQHSHIEDGMTGLLLRLIIGVAHEVSTDDDDILSTTDLIDKMSELLNDKGLTVAITGLRNIKQKNINTVSHEQLIIKDILNTIDQESLVMTRDNNMAFNMPLEKFTIDMLANLGAAYKDKYVDYNVNKSAQAKNKIANTKFKHENSYKFIGSGPIATTNYLFVP